jgi:hypothetical protein
MEAKILTLSFGILRLKSLLEGERRAALGPYLGLPVRISRIC